jgi:nitrogen fixation protein FixH
MKTSFNPWPYGIIAFFVILICCLAGMVVIASTHRESMVSEDYYEHELKFQNQINDAARATQCGARIDLDAAARSVVLRMPAGLATGNLSGTIEFYRPSASELDRQFAVHPQPDGTQRVDISTLAPGPWVVREKWTAAGQDYFLEQKIIIR